MSQEEIMETAWPFRNEFVDAMQSNEWECVLILPDWSIEPYLEEQIMTLAEVKEKFPEARTLIGNMEDHGWNFVVRGLDGTFRPMAKFDFQKGDKGVQA